MTLGNWLTTFRPLSVNATPAALRLLIAAITGATLSLSYTGFYLSIYSWVCIGILLLVIFGAGPLVAFGCGFLHGLFFCLTSVSWIAETLSVHGGLPLAGGWGLLLLMATAWGILVGCFAWTTHRLSSRSIGLACIGAPFLWTTFEFVRAHLPEISFPWNLLGYPASANSALIQLTTITGIYGLSFLVMCFNALLAWTATADAQNLRRRVFSVAAAAGAVALAMFAGKQIVPQPKASHYARAVQVNFPEVSSYTSDWFSTHLKDMEAIERLSLAPSVHHPDLLVWPETPAPFSFQDVQFARVASTLAIQFQHPFLAGAIEWKKPQDTVQTGPHVALAPYNSALLFDPQGQRTFVYDKIHLVPFGEYEPFPLIHRVVNSVSDEVGGFRRGNSYSVARLPNGYPVGVFICYEAIYPDEVRRFAASGAQLFINISNDGWFGHSAAAEQHLHMARVRAVENRRWIIRATNSGVTASVDPFGHIFRPLPTDVRVATDLPYDFRTDRTIYTQFGDWFAWLCVLVSVILISTTFRKAK
jgi:apolipoprotein N-acyltransferase